MLRPPPQPRLLLATAILLVMVAGASNLEATCEPHGLLVYALSPS